MPGSNTSVKTGSEDETRALGRALGRTLRPGDLVALEGELGSGKTVLVQGIAEALGVTATVHSPTFVLLHRYPGRVPLDHYDLYRLEGPTWTDTGLEEPSPETVSVVEWSERAAPLEGWASVRIRVAVLGPNERRLTCLKGPDRVRAVFHEQAPRA